MGVLTEVGVIEEGLGRVRGTCLSLMASSEKKPASLSSNIFLYLRLRVLVARASSSSTISPISILTQNWSCINFIIDKLYALLNRKTITAGSDSETTNLPRSQAHILPRTLGRSGSIGPDHPRPVPGVAGEPESVGRERAEVAVGRWAGLVWEACR